MRSIRTVLLACGVAFAAGCSDAPIVENEGGMDAGIPIADAGGSCDCPCGQLCVGGTCVQSVCGDGIVDTQAGELCDDSNAVAFDGCTSCQLDCSDDSMCDDGVACNGMETCAACTGDCATGRACTPGTALADGDPCQLAASIGVCRAAQCVNAGCGNGAVDPGESCDDGNTTAHDGCETDCRFTCETDTSTTNTWYLDCDADGYASSGATSHMQCLPPAPDACGGGWARRVPVAGATDCDDTRDTVHPGAPELCDSRDNNCSGTTDESCAGTPCFAASDCASGFCVDGFCCNNACDGQCEACNVGASAGTCSQVTGTPVGSRASCGGSGLCAGTCGSNRSTCDYSTGACSPQTCSGSTLTRASSCDSSHACPAGATEMCDPYVCGTGACRTTCLGDGDCIAGLFCNSGVCLPTRPNGRTCASAVGCTSGFCVDGYCCNTACGGQCQACSVTPGTCTQVTGPPVAPHTACLGTGTCEGTCATQPTQCDYPSTSCRAQSCSGSTLTQPASCSGGSCPALTTTSCAPYLCNGNVCGTTCTTDANCSPGNYCNPGVGGAPATCRSTKPNGRSCTGGSECTSGSCADGFCCDTACNGQCEACGVVPGTCTQVTGSPRGTRPACTGGMGACGGMCGSARTHCDYPTVQCRTQSCTGSTLTQAANCDGAGSCPSPTTVSCAPATCSGNMCSGACTGDGDCSMGNYCHPDGMCRSTKPNGRSCGAPGECFSGFCADGFCCNAACNGQCEACSVTPGACTQVSGSPVGSRPACAGSGTCGGVCSSSRTMCDYPTTSCRAQSCAGSTLTAAANCNGAGSCPGAMTSSCAPYACSGSSCGGSCSTDANCASGYYCNAGICRTTRPNGYSCSSAVDCTSGNCIDGYCCNSTCGSQCQACNVAGSLGTCTNVVGAPHGSRPQCNSDPNTPTCTGTCTGASATCSYPTSACHYCGNVLLSQYAYNGTCSNGTCGSGTSTGCGHYACHYNVITGQNVCYTSCSSTTQCGVLYTCISGMCN